MAAAGEILPYVSKSALVILRSTSPPGTTKTMSERIGHSHLDLAGNPLLVHCPE